jgi:excisionase family DNA binding protein
MLATMKRPASLSPQQVADACGVTRRTVYNWVENEELRTNRVGNRHRITEKQLAEKVGEELAEAAFDAHATDEA